MFISIGIDEDGRPYITTSDGSREKVVRKGKGKSVIDFPSTYTVLDIETTGLDPRYCEIIEISAMKYSSGQNIGTFSTLVKPSEPIDEYITSLTGITNDMLKSAPDISETMQKFYNFVQDLHHTHHHRTSILCHSSGLSSHPVHQIFHCNTLVFS